MPDVLRRDGARLRLQGAIEELEGLLGPGGNISVWRATNRLIELKAELAELEK